MISLVFSRHSPEATPYRESNRAPRASSETPAKAPAHDAVEAPAVTSRGLASQGRYEREAEMFHGSARAARQRTEEGTGCPRPFLGTLLLSV